MTIIIESLGSGGFVAIWGENKILRAAGQTKAEAIGNLVLGNAINMGINLEDEREKG